MYELKKKKRVSWCLSAIPTVGYTSSSLKMDGIKFEYNNDIISLYTEKRFWAKAAYNITM